MTSVCVITAACLWKQWKIEEQSLCGWMKRERKRDGDPLQGGIFATSSLLMTPRSALLMFCCSHRQRNDEESAHLGGWVVPVGRRCTRNLTSFLFPPAYTL